MIAKLEWTQSNTQQNIDQLQNPSMGVTINDESRRPQNEFKSIFYEISGRLQNVLRILFT